MPAAFFAEEWIKSCIHSNLYIHSKMNTGETSHYTAIRINEYHYHIQLHQPDKLCMVNIKDLGHQIVTNTTNIP